MAKITVNNPKNVINSKIGKNYFKLVGTGGPKGDKGDKGDTGTAATISAGTASSLPAGSSPTVTNSGTSSAAVFNFGIPKGDKGDKGDTGETGPTGPTGSDGQAATVTVGTVTTGAPGTSATVVNSGTTSAAVLDFTIPRGDKGESGSGTGDMVKADYDANNAVADAGGIASYVEANAAHIEGVNSLPATGADETLYLTSDEQKSTGSATGSAIQIQTDGQASILDFEMQGNATQNGTPTPDAPVAVNTTTGENVVKICGKNLCYKTELQGTNNIRFYFNKPSSQTFTISAIINVATSGNTLYLRVDGVDYGLAGTLTGDANSRQTKTLTVSQTQFDAIQNGIEAYLLLYKNNASFELPTDAQVENGSYTSYEPYQGQEYEVNLGKNLLNPADISQGTWLNPSITNACAFFMPIFTGETFTISNQDTATYRFACGLCATPHTGTNSQDSGWQTGTSYTITAQSNGYLYVQLRRNDAGTITPSTVPTNTYMVERGSSATAYAPYFTPIELAKIGTYQDRIYKSEGKWYVEKQVEKVVFDGSESGWGNIYVNTQGLGTVQLSLGTLVVQGNDSGICDHYPYKWVYNSNTECFYVFNQSDIGRVMFITHFTTKQDWLDWLASNPTTVYYALATPTTTEITNVTLLAQLNFIANLYEGTNTVMLVGTGAQGEITVCHSDVSRVAITGSYNDLTDKPTIPTVNDATLTIQKNGTNVQTFTANQATNATANITVPTATSDLTNDSGYITNADLPTKTSDLQNDGSDGTAAYLETDETAYKTASIPYGVCDDTSTATVFTATVPGVTELRDGVCMWLKNGVVTSASGFTININNLGAKPVYSNMAAATRDTTIWNVNYTMLFVYDSTRVSGGCWILYRGYNSDNNTIGYQVRTNSQSLPMTSVVYRYRLLFTSADNNHYVPANNSTSTNATSSRAVCQDKINPFGRIFYYSSTSSIAANARPGATALWEQYAIALGYSFNNTGAALTLTSWKPVYLKCAPQSDGSAIIDSTTPYVQDLPTTEDGKIYIFLGVAYSATDIELQLDHPVYWYKDGMIRPYTNAPAGGISSVAWGDITGTLSNQTDLNTALAAKANSADLATVATSGSYNDLSNKPTIPTVNNATLTIQKNSTNVATFTANASSNVTANITVPTKTSDLTNDSGFLDSVAWGDVTGKPTFATVATSGSYNDLSNKPTIPAAQVNSDWDAASGVAQILNKPTLATVATSGSYNDLSNKPTIPTVNNATLTIQKNGTTVKTFTANASSNVTANITVPTTVAELSDSSDYATTTDLAAKQNLLSPGNHIDITSDVISATGYVHSENPQAAAAASSTITGSMIASGTITADKLASGATVQLTLSSSDIGEGSPLAANTLYGVYI